MDRYDWLLFLHLLGAFATVATVVVLAALLLATRRATTAAEAHPVLRLSVLARRLWDVGGALTLIFGIWLAIDLEPYAITDGWILGALVLWLIAAGAGIRVGMLFQNARDGAEIATVRSGAALGLHALMAVSVLALLVLMIWKPGA